MWVFLVTEIMFFGGMFTGLHGLPLLVSERVRGGQLQPECVIGAANTAVLLCSSLTMVMAVRAAHWAAQSAS